MGPFERLGDEYESVLFGHDPASVDYECRA